MHCDNTIEFCRERRDTIRQWLDDEAPFTALDQHHLDAGSPERAYWHHGYQSALQDLLAWLDQRLVQAGAEDPPKP